MYLLIGFLAAAYILSFIMGYRRVLRLQHLNRRRIVNVFIGAVIVLSLMTLAHWLGFLTQGTAAKFTMVLYSIAAGFFCGFAAKMIGLRRAAQNIEYVHRSFWTEAAPSFIAIVLIAFGLYRTGVFSFGPFTGIGITSGFSLLGFGLFGLTLHVVPEFRYNGILILDQFVPWQRVVSYTWHSEDVLQIDYLTADKKLTDFTTFVPPEDQLIIERLLGKKLREHEQERKKMMTTEKS